MGVSGAAMYEILASGNSTFGIWLDGAANNTITGMTLADNTIAGIYLGCNAAGPIGVTCPSGAPTSTGNVIQRDLFGASGGAANVSPSSSLKQRYGVAIDTGNLRNRILEVTGTGNGTFDAYDTNPGCGTNLWDGTFANVSPTPVSSGNPFCID